MMLNFLCTPPPPPPHPALGLLALPHLVTLAELQGGYSTCLRTPRAKEKERAKAGSRAKPTAKSNVNRLRLGSEHKEAFKHKSQPAERD